MVIIECSVLIYFIAYTVKFKLKAVNKLNNEFNGNTSKASGAIGITWKML